MSFLLSLPYKDKIRGTLTHISFLNHFPNLNLESDGGMVGMKESVGVYPNQIRAGMFIWALKTILLRNSSRVGKDLFSFY